MICSIFEYGKDRTDLTPHICGPNQELLVAELGSPALSAVRGLTRLLITLLDRFVARFLIAFASLRCDSAAVGPPQQRNLSRALGRRCLL